MLAAVGCGIAMLESIYRGHICADRPLTTWDVMRSRHPLLLRGRLGRVFDTLANDRAVSTLQALALSACAVLVVGGLPHLVLSICALVAAASIVLTAIRCPYGLDGADQALVLTLTATGLAQLGGPMAHQAALVFIALQGAMSYFIAGMAKLQSSEWRRGTALVALMSTRLYGHPTIARVLGRQRLLAVALSTSITAWEVLFPLAILLPPEATAAMLTAGLLFHISCAVTMHLNTFVWAFCATYPAIQYLNELVRNRILM